jgi:enamine deaminase RidA (YjgF/YER057c/UK114 family)
LIERFGSGGPYESAVGYSRAVRAGPFVFVAGCTGMADGVLVGIGDVHAQMQQACANALAALEQAGAGAADIVQTRMYVTDITRWEQVGRAHAEAFGAHPPASAMLEVSGLIEPRMLVELEVLAFVP